MESPQQRPVDRYDEPSHQMLGGQIGEASRPGPAEENGHGTDAHMSDHHHQGPRHAGWMFAIPSGRPASDPAYGLTIPIHIANPVTQTATRGLPEWRPDNNVPYENQWQVPHDRHYGTPQWEYIRADPTIHGQSEVHPTRDSRGSIIYLARPRNDRPRAPLGTNDNSIDSARERLRQNVTALHARANTELDEDHHDKDKLEVNLPDHEVIPTKHAAQNIANESDCDVTIVCRPASSYHYGDEQVFLDPFCSMILEGTAPGIATATMLHRHAMALHRGHGPRPRQPEKKKKTAAKPKRRAKKVESKKKTAAQRRNQK